MQRPALAVAAATAAAGVAVFYAHAAQVWTRKRMRRVVAAEEAAEAAQAAEAAAAAAAGVSAPAECSTGLCDLKTTRFRDPLTGLIVSDSPSLR